MSAPAVAARTDGLRPCRRTTRSARPARGARAGPASWRRGTKLPTRRRRRSPADLGPRRRTRSGARLPRPRVARPDRDARTGRQRRRRRRRRAGRATGSARVRRDRSVALGLDAATAPLHRAVARLEGSQRAGVEPWRTPRRSTGGSREAVGPVDHVAPRRPPPGTRLAHQARGRSAISRRGTVIAVRCPRPGARPACGCRRREPALLGGVGVEAAGAPAGVPRSGRGRACAFDVDPAPRQVRPACVRRVRPRPPASRTVLLPAFGAEQRIDRVHGRQRERRGAPCTRDPGSPVAERERLVARPGGRTSRQHDRSAGSRAGALQRRRPVRPPACRVPDPLLLERRTVPRGVVSSSTDARSGRRRCSHQLVRRRSVSARPRLQVRASVDRETGDPVRRGRESSTRRSSAPASTRVQRRARTDRRAAAPDGGHHAADAHRPVSELRPRPAAPVARPR